MVNTMDNVGWNRTRGDLLHPATIVKRAGFRKCLSGRCRMVDGPQICYGRSCLRLAVAVNRFPAEALSHCVGNRLRTQSSWVRKESGSSAVIYFRKGGVCGLIVGF